MQNELPVRPRCEIYVVSRSQRKLFDEFFLYAILSENCTKDLTAFYQNVNVRANTVLYGIENCAHEILPLLGCRPNHMSIAVGRRCHPP